MPDPLRIDAAKAGGLRDVYVAAGLYREQLLPAQDVGAYGGYAEDLMERDPLLNELCLPGVTPTPGSPGTVTAIDIAAGLGGQSTCSTAVLESESRHIRRLWFLR